MNEEEGSELAPNPEKPIHKDALTVFEHLAFGSGRVLKKSDGTEILINKNNLVTLVESEEYRIGKEFFTPVGLLNGTLTSEQVMSERRRKPTFDGMFSLMLLDGTISSDESSIFDLLDDGFEPHFDLATTDFGDASVGSPPHKIEIAFPNKNAERKLSQKDIDKINPPPGMESVFEFQKPTPEHPVATISVVPSAMHGNFAA